MTAFSHKNYISITTLAYQAVHLTCLSYLYHKIKVKRDFTNKNKL